MDDGSRLPWIAAIILLFLAAWFAMVETAVSSASYNKIKVLDERGNPQAQNARYVLDRFDRAISTILICINIVHLSTASIVTVAVTRTWGMSWVTLSTFVTTFVVFYLGEMLPKSIAKRRAESLLLSYAGILCFLMKFFAPFSAFLSALGNGVSRLFAGEDEVTVTEDELYDIIDDMTEEGSLNEEQSDLISSALQFGDVTVESILTPRVDLTAVDIKDSPEEILRVVRASQHSRLPVYEGSIDNIIGILQIRTFMKAWLEHRQALDVRSLLDKPMFIHQSANIDDLLPELSRNRLNIAVVTDNYGGTLGVVSVEDILEELVGEIWDEDDVVEEEVVCLEEGLYRVDAEESVTDVFEELDFSDPEGNEELVNTRMGEWAYEQFPAIPVVGDSFRYHGLAVTVSEVEHNRILTLDVRVCGEEEAEA